MFDWKRMERVQGFHEDWWTHTYMPECDDLFTLVTDIYAKINETHKVYMVFCNLPLLVDKSKPLNWPEFRALYHMALLARYKDLEQYKDIMYISTDGSIKMKLGSK